MEKLNINYSLKNIPVPSSDSYLKDLIVKTESLIKRMRWKAFYFDKDPESICTTKDESFGLKSRKTPPQSKDLLKFESDMYNLISSIKFHKIPPANDFQKEMRDDMKNIRSSDKVIIQADKTSNLYTLEPTHYEVLLNNSITKEYKKAPPEAMDAINMEIREIASRLKLDDRMQIHSTPNCFITAKDHKDNFINTKECRVINPAKNQLGRISKAITENINKKVRSQTGMNQWTSTSQVNNWFESLNNKSRTKFILFDIEAFYPSITEGLLKKSIAFAKQYTDIPEEHVDIIMKSKKTILINNNTCWIKKDNSTFDVTMGSFDGAETSELVGLYLLHNLQNIIPNHEIGLYRDDGLAAIGNTNGPEMERIRKKIFNYFKQEGLKVSIKTNLTQVDYLDVTLDLISNSFRPYTKPNVQKHVQPPQNHQRQHTQHDL